MKTVDFSETIAARDMKVGRCRQLIELIEICEYLSSRSFLDLGYLHMKIKTCFSQKPQGFFQPNFVSALRYKEMKIH